MRKCGIVDVGSNTMRLSIYQIDEFTVQPMFNRKVMAGLASYVENGIMTQAGVAMACTTLTSFKDLLDKLDIKEFYVFATASLRNIENTNAVLREIKFATGITVDLISDEEEGIYSLKGALENVSMSDGLLADLGGGSTEIVPFKDGKPISIDSIRAGSLTLYKKFVSRILPERDERHMIDDYYESLLNELPEGVLKHDVILGVGGTFRAVAKLVDSVYGRAGASGEFTPEELEFLYKTLRKNDKPAVELILKAAPDRTHTVIPGILAIRMIIKKTEAQKVIVSRAGVREGYLYSKVLGR